MYIINMEYMYIINMDFTVHHYHKQLYFVIHHLLVHVKVFVLGHEWLTHLVT